jgi:RNA polymerase subunit RPABC4/transcription elongation factor Spt4
MEERINPPETEECKCCHEDTQGNGSMCPQCEAEQAADDKED